jgi:hypothetical protein
MTQRLHMIRQIEADLRRTSGGKFYEISWDQLDEKSLREMQRLLIDLDYEKHRLADIERAKMRRMPWLVK